MKGWLLGVVAVAMCLALPGASEGQIMMPEDMGLNYSINLGAAVAVKDGVDNNVFPSLGIAWYGSTGGEFGNHVAVGLSADWSLIRRNDGKDVNLVPILFNYRQYGMLGGYRVFVNFGVGILAASGDIPEMSIEQGAAFGWTGGLGLDISNHLYGQVRYIGGQNPGDDGQVSIQLGYRL